MKRTRRLPLQGLFNCRDLGGFMTADGGVTRFGIYLRSEAPCDLPRQDIADLLEYGLCETIDLRGTGEAGSRPSDLASVPGVTYYHKSLFRETAVFRKDQPGGPEGGPDGPGGAPDGPGGAPGGPGGAPGGPGGAPGGPGGPGGPEGMMDWGEQYKHMAETSRDWAVEVLNIAAKCPGALLYHCTTGKDRTGMLTCYLLSIAGVSRADIAADYCVSQVYLQPVYDRMKAGSMDFGDGKKNGPGAPPPQMDEGFFSTKAENMLKLIDYLTQTYGSVVEYLTGCGVSKQTMDAIREKLVEY